MRLVKISNTADVLLADMPVKVDRYGERTWAVYFGGQLLCVTVYLKGALAVRTLIERMQEELRQARGADSSISMTMPTDGYAAMNSAAVG